MSEKINQGNVLERWAKRYESVMVWLNHLQQKTLNAYSLYRFCVWANKTPDELLAEKTRDPSANTVEKLLDKFCSTEDSRFTNSFKYQASIAVKSYFHWNYHDLAKAAGAVTLQKKKPYNKLSKEGLRKLWNRTRNPRDRALIPFVTSTGIAKETLSNLTWGLLEEGWESKDLPALDIPSELIKGHGKGRYVGVKQVTFLTSEARRELSNYKEWMEQKLGRALRPDEHIWLDTRDPHEPLSYDSFSTLISRISDEAGIPFTWHDGRRWLTTALEQVGVSPNWARVLRGRKVSGSESPYSRPNIEALRAKFREAESLLSFTSEAPTISKEVEERLKALEEFKISLTPEQKEAAKRAGYEFRREVTPLKDLERAKRKQRKMDCDDGEHCEEFKQISVADLLQYLRDGWTIAHKLSNDDVIVRRSQDPGRLDSASN
jgi:hypothetical protein